MTPRQEGWLALGALAVWLTVAVIQLAYGPPLGHDEAAYALGARRLWAGDPAWWLYRSIGTELFALPGVILGTSELGLRVPAVLAGALVPVGTFLLGRAAFPDRGIAGIAAALVAGAHPMLAKNAALLGDLPAAGLLLVGLALAVSELARPEGPTRRLVLAAPILAAAFYVRYGSIVVLACTALALAVMYRRAILARPRPVIAAAAVAVLAIVPHFGWSVMKTGSLLGVLDESAGATRLAYTGEGLVTYLTTNPFKFYGIAIAPLMVAGAITAFTRDRAARCLGGVALGSLVVLGLRSHAQPRYIYGTVAILVVLGCAGIAALTARATPRARRAVAIATAVVIAATWLAAVGLAPGRVRAVIKSSRPFVADAALIRADTAGRPCMLVTAYQPRLLFYSGCTRAEDYLPRALRTYVVDVPGYEIGAETAARARGPAEPLAGTAGRVWVVPTP